MQSRGDHCEAGNSATDGGERLAGYFPSGLGLAVSDQVIVFLLSASLHGVGQVAGEQGEAFCMWEIQPWFWPLGCSLRKAERGKPRATKRS